MAIEPPTVPRLRVGVCPTKGSAFLMRGRLPRASSLRSTSTWRVTAPMTRAPSSERMPPSSFSRTMLTSFVGRASRIASMGIRVWPPAMIRASSSAARISQTSASELGLRYANAAGFILFPWPCRSREHRPRPVPQCDDISSNRHRASVFLFKPDASENRSTHFPVMVEILLRERPVGRFRCHRDER